MRSRSTRAAQRLPRVCSVSGRRSGTAQELVGRPRGTAPVPQAACRIEDTLGAGVMAPSPEARAPALVEQGLDLLVQYPLASAPHDDLRRSSCPCTSIRSPRGAPDDRSWCPAVHVEDAVEQELRPRLACSAFRARGTTGCASLAPRRPSDLKSRRRRKEVLGWYCSRRRDNPILRARRQGRGARRRRGRGWGLNAPRRLPGARPRACGCRGGAAVEPSSTSPLAGDLATSTVLRTRLVSSPRYPSFRHGP